MKNQSRKSKTKKIQSKKPQPNIARTETTQPQIPQPETTQTAQTFSREEEAELTLARTQISRRLAAFITLVFLLIISIPPIVQHFAGPPRKKGDRGFRALLPTRGELLKVRGLRSAKLLLPTPEETKKFETKLEREALLSQNLLPVSQNVMSGFFRAGNEQVYMGRDRWLFAKVEIDYLTGKGFLDPEVLQRAQESGVQPDPLKAILDFNRQLQSRGIKLIVAPIPSKATIHPEQFSGVLNPAWSTPDVPENVSYPHFLDELNSSGIAVFHAGPTLLRAKKLIGEPQYFPGDTHWTPQAMTRVARDLAAFVEENATLSPRKPARYRLLRGKEKNMTDLEVMLKLPANQTIFPRQRANVRRVVDADGKLWKPQLDAEILLLGDSFTNIFSRGGYWGNAAGLAEHLSFYLQRPTDKIALNGGGAEFVRRTWHSDLKNGKRKADKTRVVIYEFATRTLVNNDWKLIDFSSTLGANHSAAKPLQR